METFGICLNGLASAAHLLVPLYAFTPAEVIELFRRLAELFELYDCHASAASLVEVYNDHVLPHFTQLRTCSLKADSKLPRSLT